MARFVSLLVLLAAVLATCMRGIGAEDAVALSTTDDELDSWSGRALLESAKSLEKMADHDMSDDNGDDNGDNNHDDNDNGDDNGDDGKKKKLIKKLRKVKAKIAFWRKILWKIKEGHIKFHSDHHKKLVIWKIRKVIKFLRKVKKIIKWKLKKLKKKKVCDPHKCNKCRTKHVKKLICKKVKKHWGKKVVVCRKVWVTLYWQQKCKGNKCVEKKVDSCH